MKTGSLRRSGVLWLALAAVAGAAFGQEETALKPIPGLSQEKFGKVEDLRARLREQQRNLMSLPDSAQLIRADEELKKFCTASDLVAITFSEDHKLSQAAFMLLRGPFNAALTADHVAGLLKHLRQPPAEEAWRAGWVSRALGVNRRLGVPALVKILRESDDVFARVHAAGGLFVRGSAADGNQRRAAAEFLLKSLGNEDDTSREAHNYAQPLEPWMAEWLVARLADPALSANFVKNATSLLAHYRPQGLDEQLKAVYLRALEQDDPAARINAVNGLRSLGLSEADLPLYARIRKDENPHVRRMLYAGLCDVKAPWAAGLLTAGLDDSLPDNLGICACGLAALGHKPAVPKLIEVLRRAPARADQPFEDGYRQAGEAAVKLAGLEGYDFRQLTESVGNRFFGAELIVERPDVYRSERARLLKWWDTTGSKLSWD